MKFRPCIDIHNGKVKQLVGGSLKDEGDSATENFVAQNGGAYFANLYKEDNLSGGHIIILNAKDSKYYEATKNQAMEALKAYPLGMQIGGGIDDLNAKDFIECGASHVIVTSYVFKDGKVNFDNLEKIMGAVGKEHLVLDLSCRKKDDRFYIVTDRWQKFTDMELTMETLTLLSKYCDEYLIHGVDVEGKGSGMDEGLVRLLSEWKKENIGTGITYAGGIASLDDIKKFKEMSDEMLDFTIGSALDIFGGNLSYKEIARKYS